MGYDSHILYDETLYINLIRYKPKPVAIITGQLYYAYDEYPYLILNATDSFDTFYPLNNLRCEWQCPDIGQCSNDCSLVF